LAESVQQIPSADALTAPATLFGSRTLRRMLAAFTHRDFRVQWIGACTSSVGTWTQLTAQNWLILSLTGSAFFLGLDGFLQQLPIMLFTLIGGVLADRLDRRRTLLASQYLQMTTALALALLVFLGVVRIWHILVLSFTTGLAQAFGGPAYQALIPSLVEDKKDLPNAIAFNSIQINIARVLGPLVFGATITAFAKWGFTDVQGMAACFLVNALSFLVVISTLNMLRVKHIPYTGTTRMRDELRGGLAYVRHHGSLAALTVLAFATTFLGFAVLQFLSIPQSAQVAAGSAGGVVDLNRRYGGADARWSWKGELAQRPMTWVVGLSYDHQNELRRGYNNFTGSELGVQGALRRDENNVVHNLDEYAQGAWDFASLWSLMVGVRRSDVKFDSEDHYITATNGDDSGGVTYGATSPVAGLMFKPQDWLRVYASYGQGFQTPLGSELAYRPDGGAGLNLGLQPARSNNTELGVKVGIDPDITAEFAVFQAQTRNEIVVDTNVGGRSTYQNSGRTRRRGAEYSLNYRIATDWRFQLAYTYVDAYYSDAYLTCIAAPCATPTVRVDAGNRLPGVPKHNAYASLRWGADQGWHASLSGQYITDVAVNDVNTVFAPAYALMGLDGSYGVELRGFKMNAFLRVNNLLNRHYVGSIIVNDGNSRYFEPGPGFNVLGGVSVTLK